MADVKIQVLTNGPLLVKGPMQLVDMQDKPIQGKPGDAVALCRCGHSANKPFCDGAHKQAGFQG